jgi:hypothetical protein
MQPTSPIAATGPRYRVMFIVPFHTAMGDADIHRLNSVLDMRTHLHPKLHASPASAGVSRLNFHSGLFLIRGDGSREWRLEGRTWDVPAPETVHEWHLVAADAARLLDPAVPVPPRLETAGPDSAQSRRPQRRADGR